MIDVILIGTAHPHVFARLRYLAARADINVLGFFEKDPAIASKIQPFIDCKHCTTLTDLLSLPFQIALIHGLDADNASYLQQAISAGARGIFLDKPGVSHPAEFYPLAYEISSNSIIFESGWELNYCSPFRLAHKILSENVLGNITSARFHGGCPAGAGLEPWQSSIASIGGAFYSIGGHMLQPVVALFGLPMRVVSSIRRLPLREEEKGVALMPDVFGPKKLLPDVQIGGLALEDIASAILEYEHCNITVDFTAWEPSGYCEEWSVEVVGTRGVLKLKPDPPWGVLFLRERIGEWEKGRTDLFPGNDQNPKLELAFQEQLDIFFRRCLGEVCEQSCDETLTSQLLVLMEALYKSTRGNSWVDIDNRHLGLGL